jgi:hypothetical protein
VFPTQFVSTPLSFTFLSFAAMSTRCTISVALSAVALSGCAPPAPRRNQVQGTPSTSGKYVLRLPIEAQTTKPQYKGTGVWKVTIADSSGTVLYKDENSTMVGTLNVYWGWDDQDRVWVYNSDDGRIWRWESATDGWKKIESQKSDGIPDFVLPDYAKKH